MTLSKCGRWAEASTDRTLGDNIPDHTQENGKEFGRVKVDRVKRSKESKKKRLQVLLFSLQEPGPKPSGFNWTNEMR